MEERKGRITSIRRHKNVDFFDLYQGEVRHQLVIPKSTLPENDFQVGDIVMVRGNPGVTRTGEASIFVENTQILTRPSRYIGHDLDLVKLLEERREILKIVRRVFSEYGVEEVSSGILSTSSGTSQISPFKTSDQEGIDLYLRFTLEQELKKYVSRTLLPVFEIGKVFRNMGYSHRYFREYTVVESYLPFQTLEQGMDLVKRIFLESSNLYRGNLDTPGTLNVSEQCKKEGGSNLSSWKEYYTQYLKKQEGPVFLINPPREWSPLSAYSSEGWAQDAELVYRGVGVAHICQENTNAQEVRTILSKQLEKVKLLREDAVLDEDFVLALENGFPPTVGMCIGLDRLLMGLKDTSNLMQVIPLGSRK